MTEAYGNTNEVAVELAQAIGQLRRTLRRSQRELYTDGAFSSPEYELLRYVYDHPNVRVGVMANALSIAPNTASTLIKRLMKLGILNRTTSDNDRRVGTLCLTPYGEETISTLRDHRLSLLVRGLDDINLDAKAAIISAIPALLELIKTIQDFEGSPSCPFE